MKKSNIIFLVIVIGLMLILGLGVWLIRCGYNASVTRLHYQTYTLLAKAIQTDLDERSKVMDGDFRVCSYSSSALQDSSVLITANGEKTFERDTALSDAQKLQQAFARLSAAIVMDTQFVEGLPTMLMKPLSGSGARGMMVDAMNTYGADSFVGIRNTRYTVPCSLLADLAGAVAAVILTYVFFT